MKSVCVYCASSDGIDPKFGKAADELGLELVRRGIRLVYGGASVGLMGRIATTVQQAGGRVTGVIPRILVEREIAKTDLDDLRVVETMHERKGLMAELSDGFVAMPGGLGTLEEIFEVLTWGQLGMHKKPCGFLNIAGYYSHLLQFLDNATATGLLQKKNRARVLVHETPTGLLDLM